jgi:hypothetical protein
VLCCGHVQQLQHKKHPYLHELLDQHDTSFDRVRHVLRGAGGVLGQVLQRLPQGPDGLLVVAVLVDFNLLDAQ